MNLIGYKRDRTLDFLNARNLIFQQNLDEQTIEIINEIQQTQYQQTIDLIKLKLEQTLKNIQELKILQKKYLNIDLDDYNDLSNKIDFKTNQIKNELKFIQNDVIKFGKFKEIENPIIIQNIQKNLIEELKNVQNIFKEENKNYLIKLKKRTSKFNDCFTNEENNENYSIGFDENQLNLIEESSELLNHRVEEIKKIVNVVQELAEMSKELNFLVHEQGDLIERIEFNIDSVEMYTNETIREIERAEKYQKATRVKKIILILMILIFGAFLILVIKIMI